MSTIHVLSDALVNKIAAGEVIERPASVVKELLENSLDAGASWLRIDVEDGGRKLIRVTDDGVGMSSSDLAMCVQSHATSKITSEDDLFAISTMGFRGEALPSIASVAQMRVVSRPKDQDAGHEITVTGGRSEPARAAAAPPGTCVEVRNLFFNVPARRKFIRGANTEYGHIVDQLAKVALAHPAVGFELTHNRRTMYHLEPTESLTGRIGNFYGRELADSLLSVSSQRSELSVSGFVAPPVLARSAAKWQFSFLNGRFVRDRFVQHAVKEAFRGLVDPAKYPVAFLYLRLDPRGYDVNVHPTKIEVRWQDSNLVHSAVLAALRDVLLRSDLTPALETTVAEDDPSRVRSQQVREAIADFFKRSEPAQRRMEFTPPTSKPARPAPPRPEPSLSRSASLPPTDVSVTAPLRETRSAAPPEAPRAIQIHNTYLVAETPEGVVIIDQHALHERIMYQQLSERIMEGNLETQRLLLPEPVAVTPRQKALLTEHTDLLKRLGVEVSSFGPGTAAVQAFPSLLNHADAPEFVRALLDKLSEKGHTAHPENLLQEMVEMMACKAAVKAGDPLTGGEIEDLIAQRDLVEKSSSCPHGRPTALKLTLRDLEKQFKRV
ncbi:MAG: DNA mismatch repair endonuclease MutL [Phycisphaerales bacterium]|nr:MAG: DNA mismatch repair endonuclease MutL [Phycisphaerales bacterium]